MIDFDEKIEQFTAENVETRKVVEIGSDEYLDKLISIRNKLATLTSNYEKFLADIISGSNSLSNDSLEKSMPVLLDLYSSSISSKFKTKPFFKGI
jgi:hypothetical protein